MKAKNLIAALLMTVGLQTAQAQKIILHMPDNQTVEYDISQLDSITFVGGESADVPAFLTCPNDQHPHAIDLGLPSGTKWCCCNVDANVPEGTGNYYAWGETATKDSYGFNNYLFFDREVTYNYIDIGTDIAGTSYDAATIRMGMPWHMPTLEQMKEIYDNCTIEWTQKEGVKGMLVTGKNEGQIFLPATGVFWDTNINAVGNAGSYWCSVLCPSEYGTYREEMAYLLSFNIKQAAWLWNANTPRYTGHTIRAVCK